MTSDGYCYSCGFPLPIAGASPSTGGFCLGHQDQPQWWRNVTRENLSEIYDHYPYCGGLSKAEATKLTAERDEARRWARWYYRRVKELERVLHRIVSLDFPHEESWDHGDLINDIVNSVEEILNKKVSCEA